MQPQHDVHAALDPGTLPMHMHRLRRVARGLCGSEPDSEDLVQETFARVLARPRMVREADTLPYLLQALRNTHLTGIREAGRRPRTVELPDDESSSLRSSSGLPEAALECREVLAAVAALARSVPHRARRLRRRRHPAPPGGGGVRRVRGHDRQPRLPRAQARPGRGRLTPAFSAASGARPARRRARGATVRRARGSRGPSRCGRRTGSRAGPTGDTCALARATGASHIGHARVPAPRIDERTVRRISCSPARPRM